MFGSEFGSGLRPSDATMQAAGGKVTFPDLELLPMARALHTDRARALVLFTTPEHLDVVWARPLGQWRHGLTKDEHIALRHPSQFTTDLIGLPARGSRWRHFKGGLYMVAGSALFLNDAAPLVLYRATDNTGPLWARPASEWGEPAGDTSIAAPRFIPLQLAAVA